MSNARCEVVARCSELSASMTENSESEDRERKRIAELEEECRILAAELGRLKTEADEIVRALKSEESPPPKSEAS